MFRLKSFPLFISIAISVFVSQLTHAQVFIPMTSLQCQSILTRSETSAADFSAGTFTNTTLVGNSLTLGIGQTSGTFTSQVFDVFGGCTPIFPFYSFGWKTTLPYGKELPATSEVAADYSGIASNLMNGIVGLWRFNETTTGTAPNGFDIADFSGNGLHGKIISTGQTMGVAGKLNKGLRFNDVISNYVNIPYNPIFNLRTDVTYSVWYYRSAAGSDWGRLIGRNIDSSSRQFGIWDLTTVNPRGVLIQSYLGGCEWNSTTTMSYGNWYHIVFTMSGGVEKLYINGVLDSSRSGCSAFVDDQTSPLTIGASNNLHRSVNGIIDEAAVWNRALTATEVLQVYRRGANRINFQIKSCTTSTCGDNPSWIGPDGTSGTSFSELNNNTLQATGLGNVLTTSPTMYTMNFPSLNLTTNRFFQYQATLQTDNVTDQPEIVSTSINRKPTMAAGYSVRRAHPGYLGQLMRVRRSADNAEKDIAATSTGDLDTATLLDFTNGNYPLDALSVNATAAYSVRKLRSGYNAYSMRVRRSSDNAEQDIGFTSAGNLDTTTLAAFCPAAAAPPANILSSLSASSSAAYSLRKLRSGYSGSAIRVRRASDNVEQDIGFDGSGHLDQASLLTFVGATRPLDLMSASAAAAFSLRKIKTSYAGSAIRVRRSSDDTEQDIGFDGGGYLDQTALLAFVGTGNGFVKTWYDQSGNSLHATQATNANQPQIVNAGSIYTLNSKPTLNFNGSAVLVVAAQYNRTSFPSLSINAVYKENSYGSGTSGLWGQDNGNFPRFQLLNYAPNAGLSYGIARTATATPVPGMLNANNNIYTAVLNANSGSSSIYINGASSLTFTEGTDSGAVYTNLAIGALGAQPRYPMNGLMAEFVVHTSAISSADRVLLEHSQSAFYSITYSGITNTLDNLTASSAVAYSLRKLRSAYAGSAIQVRRSSDNATQDIGFDASGNLDQTALLTFVGAGNGYVVYWYDQSGNGYHVSQTTNSLQPLIVSAGVVNKKNNLPAVLFDGSTTHLSAVGGPFGGSVGSFASVFSGSGVAVNNENVLPNGTATNYNPIFYVGTDSKPRGGIYNGSGLPANLFPSATVLTPSNLNLLSWKSDGTNQTLYSNGVSQGTTTGFYATNSYFTLGTGYTNQWSNGNGGWYYLNGNISEVIGFASSISTADQTVLNNSQGLYYGLNINGSVTEHAYVKTWYDQSGNGHDVTQATTANQPRIVNAGVIDSNSGKPAIYYQGNQHSLNNTTLPFANPYSINAVFSRNGTSTESGSFGRFIHMGGAASDAYGFIGTASGKLATFSGSGSSWNDTSVNSPNVALTNNVPIVVTTNIATGGTGFVPSVNGFSQNSKNGTTTAGTGINIGGIYTAGAGQAWGGTASEVVLFPAALSATDRAALESSQSSYYSVSAVAKGCFVKTWYDQSGNGHHATQTSTGQPRIVNNGVIDVTNTKPSLVFLGQITNLNNTTVPFSTSYSLNTVFARNGTSPEYGSFGRFINMGGGVADTFAFIGSSNGRIATFVGNGAGSWNDISENVTNVTMANNTPNVVTMNIATGGSGLAPFANGTAQTTKNGTTVAGTGINIGGLTTWTSQQIWGGTSSEVFVFPSTLSTADRQALEASQGMYYGVTVSGVNTTTNAFVRTWYDQSGNSNHAQQTTSGNQPQIVASGVVNTQNTKPALNFVAASSNFLQMTSYPFASASQALINVVFKNSASGVWGRIFDLGNNTSINFFSTPSSSGSQFRWRMRTAAVGEQGPIATPSLSADTLSHVLSFSHTGTSMSVFKDSVLYGSASGVTLLPSSITPANANYLGKSQYADPYLNGNYQEILFYPNALNITSPTASDWKAIQADQKNYFSTP